MWNWKIILCSLIGGVLIVAAVIAAIVKARWISTTKVATGRILSVAERTDDEGEHSYYPTIEFTTEGGARQTFESKTGGGQKEFAVGNAVSIRYQPDNPGSAAINNFMHLYLASIILGFIGVMFAVFAVCMLFTGQS
jgi:hypothetical protein